MVKKKTGSSRLREKFNKSKESRATEEQEARPSEGQDEALPPRKLRNKIAKRVSFFEKVAQSSLAAKSTIKKRRRRTGTGAALGDLSALSDALQGVETEAVARKHKPAKGLSVGGAKKRKQISAQETVRLQQVLAHPEFQKDPLAAVASHLDAMLPPVEPKSQPKKNISGSRRQKMRKQKARMDES